jgi:hypothetical protein
VIQAVSDVLVHDHCAAGESPSACHTDAAPKPGSTLQQPRRRIDQVAGDDMSGGASSQGRTARVDIRPTQQPELRSGPVDPDDLQGLSPADRGEGLGEGEETCRRKNATIYLIDKVLMPS